MDLLVETSLVVIVTVLVTIPIMSWWRRREFRKEMARMRAERALLVDLAFEDETDWLGICFPIQKEKVDWKKEGF